MMSVISGHEIDNSKLHSLALLTKIEGIRTFSIFDATLFSRQII